MSKYYPLTTITVRENTYGGFATIETLKQFAQSNNLDETSVGIDLDNWGSSSIEPVLVGTRAATDEEKADHKAKWEAAKQKRKEDAVKKLVKAEKTYLKIKKEVEKELK